MKQFLKPISYILSVVLPVLIIYLMSKRSDFSETIKVLKEAQLIYLVPVIIASFFGVVARALRWQMLFIEQQPKVSTCYHSLMSGYCVNYGIPRLGEITRSYIIKKRAAISFSQTLGTVVIERAIDILSLFSIVAIVVLMQFDKFINVYQAYLRTSVDLVSNYLNIYAITIFFLICAFIVWYLFIKQNLFVRLKQYNSKFHNFINGIVSIFNVPSVPKFLLLTLVIWVSYFFTSYLVFYCFPDTQNLSIAAGLAVLAFGSIARSIPLSIGSAGLYHTVVAYTLGLFLVERASGEAIAIVIHGTQMLFYVCIGALSLFRSTILT